MVTIEEKQKELGTLAPEQKKVYALVAKKIAGMHKKDKIKLLKRKSNIDKLIKDAREELING